MRRPAKCPECGSHAVEELLYGMMLPPFPERTIPMGCVIDTGDAHGDARRAIELGAQRMA